MEEVVRSVSVEDLPQYGEREGKGEEEEGEGVKSDSEVVVEGEESEEVVGKRLEEMKAVGRSRKATEQLPPQQNGVETPPCHDKEPHNEQGPPLNQVTDVHVLNDTTPPAPSPTPLSPDSLAGTGTAIMCARVTLFTSHLTLHHPTSHTSLTIPHHTPPPHHIPHHTLPPPSHVTQCPQRTYRRCWRR